MVDPRRSHVWLVVLASQLNRVRSRSQEMNLTG